MEKIEQAAVWYFGGFNTLPRPYRHADILLDIEGLRDPLYGFLTSKGRFVTRKEAYPIAENAGQIISRPDVTPTPGILYTEDLW